MQIYWGRTDLLPTAHGQLLRLLLLLYGQGLLLLLLLPWH
jgi:hypothetical protein